MKRLSDTQKTAIRNLRSSGLGYKSIAERLSLSRETVRSFCTRNDIPAKADTAELAGEKNHECGATEIKSGNTVFIITTAYSENATESLEKKLEKLILDDAARQFRCYQFVQESA